MKRDCQVWLRNRAARNDYAQPHVNVVAPDTSFDTGGEGMGWEEPWGEDIPWQEQQGDAYGGGEQTNSGVYTLQPPQPDSGPEQQQQQQQ